MTRDEQTIANLKKLKSVHNGSYGADIDRAIKALEQEPFMNKLCVAHQVCHEDKVKMLDKIRAEIEEYSNNTWRPTGNSLDNAGWWACNKCIEIIDKYREGGKVNNG